MRVVEPGCGMGFFTLDLVRMVHELEQPAAFFAEITTALKPDGAILVVEPPLLLVKSAA
jgi:hypothetical protein